MHFRIIGISISLMALLGSSCGNTGNSAASIELITRTGQQDSIFKSLQLITGNNIPDTRLDDSLAFLILPVQASCPSCRNKTIDSIVAYKDKLASNHYIIISANAGRKSISGYFRSEDAELPVMENTLFLDTTDLAYKNKLYDEKPTMYYTYQRRAYKKVAAIPATVKQDLQEFFSGHRNQESR